MTERTELITVAVTYDTTTTDHPDHWDWSNGITLAELAEREDLALRYVGARPYRDAHDAANITYTEDRTEHLGRAVRWYHDHTPHDLLRPVRSEVDRARASYHARNNQARYR